MRSFGHFIFSRLSRLLQNRGSALLVSKTARGSLTVFGLYLCISHFSQSLEKEAVTVVGYVNEQSAVAHSIPSRCLGITPWPCYLREMNGPRHRGLCSFITLAEYLLNEMASFAYHSAASPRLRAMKCSGSITCRCWRLVDRDVDVSVRQAGPKAGCWQDADTFSLLCFCMCGAQTC